MAAVVVNRDEADDPPTVVRRAGAAAEHEHFAHDPLAGNPVAGVERLSPSAPKRHRACAGPKIRHRQHPLPAVGGCAHPSYVGCAA